MKLNLIGDSAYPLAEIQLDNGETAKVARGSMTYMRDVEIKGKMNGKGVFSMIGRALTSGEEMFITSAEGTYDGGVIGISPSTIGNIVKLEVGDNQYRLNTGAYLASDSEVDYRMVKQKLSHAFFGGTGGLFVMETTGYGDVLISSFGDIVELEVTDETPLTIDNDHVLAWDANLDYSIHTASGAFGFTTGEGLVNTFEGNGKVLIQTRNFTTFAELMIPFIPKQTNNE